MARQEEPWLVRTRGGAASRLRSTTAGRRFIALAGVSSSPKTGIDIAALEVSHQGGDRDVTDERIGAS